MLCVRTALGRVPHAGRGVRAAPTMRMAAARGAATQPRREPRTVALADVPDDVRAGTAAQILNAACPKDAAHFLAARDSAGRPVALSAHAAADAGALTFLPFDADDRLAQRSFWLSGGYLLGFALRRVFGDAAVRAAAPDVAVSTAPRADAASGFAYTWLPSAGAPEALADTPEAPAAVDRAVRRLIDAQVARGAPRLASEELAAVERAMLELANGNHNFVLDEVAWDEAWGLFAAEPLKLQALLGARRERVPVVRLAGTPYVDLWPGGLDAVLLRRSKALKAHRLLGWSTVTLPGLDGGVQPALRARGIAFPSAAELQQFAADVEASEKADHRVVGQAQQLFFAHDVSPGSPFMLPHGMRLMRKMERVLRDLYDAFGYEEVQSPQLFRSALWKQSGHWDQYREDMFGAEGLDALLGRSSCCGQQDDAEAGVFGIKPMNCPGHCVMYQHQPRSYRELPLRLAEFSPLHRNEASGALTGLTRVRRFLQDDAHVFCTPAQVRSEIATMLHMLALAYRVFGFGSRFELVLSTRPERFIGEERVWAQAEAQLKDALDASGRDWTLNEGDGAFYGPKIDIRLVDAMGRKHQTATIQLDFQLPERFALEYADPEARGAPRDGFARPVMIHRAILGSFERFLAILIEQCAGWWPFWLSPRQAVVIPTFGAGASEAEVVAYATHVRHVLAHGDDASGAEPKGGDARVDPFPTRAQDLAALVPPTRTRFGVELPAQYLSATGETLGRKIRQAQLSRFNFLVIVGPNEAQSQTVSLRMRDERAAPAWLPGEHDGAPAKVAEEVYDVARRAFPGRAWGERNAVDLGRWSLEEVRRLFCVLDAVHA